MVHFFLIVTILFAPFLFGQEPVHEEHAFRGKHFVGSYLDCDLRSISDLDSLMCAMDDAVRASGATILDKTVHIFAPNGLTIVYLLSESHASLHTYPEYGHCFIDLFTCGDNCSSEKFHQVLHRHLRPKISSVHLFSRGEDLQEIPFPQSP